MNDKSIIRDNLRVLEDAERAIMSKVERNTAGYSERNQLPDLRRRIGVLVFKLL